ncbi:MAG TPA: ribosome maturation factor RimM [Phnomibacter sp.]|nr:ribosome maturation factor RimM [Phnomibacter sp.]
MQHTVSIGRFVACHGLKGQLVLKHGLGHKTHLPGLQVLFVEDRNGSKLPYFVKEAKAKSQEESWVTLEDINTREAAQHLTQKTVWMQQADFERLAAPNATIGLLGYAIVENGKTLGTVQEVIEQPHQVLCTIEIEGREVYIPLHEATLQRIDRRKKHIHVTLPEGLLQVYLG